MWRTRFLCAQQLCWALRIDKKCSTLRELHISFFFQFHKFCFHSNTHFSRVGISVFPDGVCLIRNMIFSHQVCLQDQEVPRELQRGQVYWIHHVHHLYNLAGLSSHLLCYIKRLQGILNAHTGSNTCFPVLHWIDPNPNKCNPTPKGKVWHFGKHVYSLSLWELDEKIETTTTHFFTWNMKLSPAAS